jgi:hypothetical protein
MFQGSFMVWNPKTAKKKDPSNLDPNYLTAAQQVGLGLSF